MRRLWRRLTRRSFLRLGAAAAVITVAGALPEQEAETMSPGVSIFDYAIEGDDRPLPEAVALDRWRSGRFSVVIAQRGMLKAVWPKLAAANPSLVWAVYMNATHTTNQPPHFPADWYARNAAGGVITATDFPGNYLMNPLSGWRAYREDTTAALLADSGAPATYADELGVGPIYSIGQPAIDPRTSLPWTWPDWCVEMDATLAGLAARTGLPVYANGLGNGKRYFEGPTSTLLDHCDGALAESFLRGAMQPASYFPTPATYDREVRMLEDAGGGAMACTKLWAPTTDATRSRVLRWALGTFLLGAAPGAAWYSTAGRASTVTPWRGEWTSALRLGAPLGPREGLHRAFEGGSVTVNNVTRTALITVG